MHDFSAGVSAAVPAGQALQACMKEVGGRGGGSATFAQGIVDARDGESDSCVSAVYEEMCTWGHTYASAYTKS